MPTFAEYTAALNELAGADLPDRTSALDAFGPARGRRVSRSSTPRGCGAGRHVCSVSVQDVNPCSFLGPTFNAGNIRETPFGPLA